MSDEFVVTDAVREEVALLTALYGPTGSGKTFSGLLLAGGMAGPDGLVGMVDAENKRGSLYADDPMIRAAMPGGRTYKRVDLYPPYTPQRYIKALKALENAGCTVALIDSTTHEWAGEGGCCDIAAANKIGGLDNWPLAKLEHKRFMAHCLSSKMHIIFCLRAHDKAKPVKKGDLVSPDSAERYDKSGYIQLGIQPDTEKNLVYEVLLSFRVDDKTHMATPVKVPGMLKHIFPGPKLLSKADGDEIRKWNEGGRAADPNEKLRERARLAATDGVMAYQAFYKSLTTAEKKVIFDTDHETNKYNAEQADIARVQQSQESGEESQPQVA
jgi:hypothetical protein